MLVAMLRIAIGSDHAGFELKQHIVQMLNTAGHVVDDQGTTSTEPVDYPAICAGVGRTVRDADGRALGPLEEIRIAEHDGEAFVLAYCVGAYGLFQRLAGTAMRRSLLRLFGQARKGGAYVVPWDRMDLSDPSKPRLRGPVDGLRRADD